MKRKIFLKGALTALFLSGAALAQTETPAPEALPETAPAAGGESAAPVDWALRAGEAFAANFKEACASTPDQPPLAERQAEVFELKYKNASDAPEDPERTASLYRFFCDRGAYNESHVFYLNSGEELSNVGFAEPFIHVDYENEDSDGKVLGIRIVGLRSQNVLVNSSVDAKTFAISSAKKWRGVGDASSSGTWLFRDGAFVLSTFEVDASYDGEINPQMVTDYRAENEALSETP